MSDKNKQIEFLDWLWGVYLDRYDHLPHSKQEAQFTEIKGIVVDYYDLIERLRNINFPVEKKREK